MDIKNEVLYRVYGLLFGVLVPVAVLLVYRTVEIAVLQGPEWKARAAANYIQERDIEPERGNIFAADGSLLATSVPYFDIYFDPFVASDEDYFEHLDTLAYLLATFVDNTYTVGGMRERLLMLRNPELNSSNFVPIKKQVSYAEKRRMEQFPLFNLGRFRGGFIAEKRSERKRPFGLLARRTIGYDRAGYQSIGLEGTFDQHLGGEPGKQIMFKVDPRQDLWMPIEDLTVVEPRTGDDIVTTIDVNMQDIAETALLRSLRHHQAEWGTALVMEVETGAIRAIANLGRDESEQGYYEMYNYGIAMATEPGSTFKLATIMALLEDEHVTLRDSVNIERGRTEFYDAEMVDATDMSKRLDSTTVQRAFEISSNVGMAKLVDQYYGTGRGDEREEGAREFIERLQSFNLHLPVGIEIEGEADPYIKEPFSEEDQWSGLTLPWMATGYELRITPLQLLTFYNAVANNGRMMKPFLVDEIRRNGEVVEDIKPTVIKKKLASKSTIEQARILLEGVVQQGTATKLRTDRYSFAGKTGTAQLNYHRGSRGTQVGGYQASFAGYFPADNPKYSVIVVINKPRRGSFYGGDVAGPVFREIADKCFNAMIELHEPLNRGPRPVLYASQLPQYDVGFAEDIRTVLDYLNLPAYGTAGSEIAVVSARADSLLLQSRSLAENTMPSVIGMGARDALYVLENRGLKVKVQGVGRVRQQSLLPGTRLRGQTVTLKLN